MQGRAEPENRRPSGIPAPEAEHVLLQFAELGALLRQAVLDTAAESSVNEDLITNSSLRLLLRLDLTGPMRPRAIQELTGLSSGGVTKLVDRLEAAALVERRHNISDDGRGVGVHIMPDGQQLVAAMSTGLEAWIPEVQRVVKEFTRAIDQGGEERQTAG